MNLYPEANVTPTSATPVRPWHWEVGIRRAQGRSARGRNSTYYWARYQFGVNLTLRWWREFRGLKVRLGFFNCRIGWFRVFDG